MAKYDGLLGQPLLEVEEPDKEGGITFIFKDNRFLFVKADGDKVQTISIPEVITVGKFDAVKMSELVSVKDEGDELVLVFQGNTGVRISISEGRLTSEVTTG